ncbi:MAG: UTRA domain-containing protein [Actinomadura sp.]
MTRLGIERYAKSKGKFGDLVASAVHREASGRAWKPTGQTQTVYARMPTQQEIDLMQLPGGEPVTVLHRKTFTRDGRLVGYARGIHSASRFSWSYMFKIPD